MPETSSVPALPRLWTVGALCRAIADALEARFSPVEVTGEISGFTRVVSGHCYFSLKDEAGQLRCAMFRRTAGMLDFTPSDGMTVVARARVGVYEPRGELQLVVEHMSRAGKGALFEQFLRLKAKLETEGLFETARKRPIPAFPRAIGLVTSLAGAALHDVATVLRRRAPHVSLLIAPAPVQGAGAAQAMVQAIASLAAMSQHAGAATGGPFGPATGLAMRMHTPLDLILLVRGGGSMEDLWAFNDEALARAIATCPVPVIAGIGHETDFTIADLVADLRAPTPTAAAELAAPQRQTLQEELDGLADGFVRRLRHRLERSAQSLDLLASRLSHPSGLLSRQGMLLAEHGRRLSAALGTVWTGQRIEIENLGLGMHRHLRQSLDKQSERLARCELRLASGNPRQVLRRGFVWATGPDGKALNRVADMTVGAAVTLQFVDGQVDASVTSVRCDP